jgi:hypothetical protein
LQKKRPLLKPLSEEAAATASRIRACAKEIDSQVREPPKAVHS